MVHNFQLFPNVVEVGQVEFVQVVRVLNMDEVFPRKWLIGQ